MVYKSFEDLEVYKAAREFRKKVYKLIKRLPLVDYLYELKNEGYRINKMLNGYIAYLKKRKSGESNQPNQLNQPNQPINPINQ